MVKGTQVMKGKTLFLPARLAVCLALAVLIAVSSVRPTHAEAAFASPGGVAVDRQGNVYVADTGNSRIVKLSSSGHILSAWDEHGTNFANGTPTGVAVDRLGNVYVTDGEYNSVLKYAPNGRLLAQWGTSGDGEFSSPQGIAVGDRGNVFVANTNRQTIEKLAPNGYILDTWPSQATYTENPVTPIAIAVDHTGNVYVAGTRSWDDTYLLQRRAPDGQLLDEWSGLGDLGGVAIGGRGNVFVTDSAGGRVLKLSPGGEILAQWGMYEFYPGGFQNPSGIAVGGSGNVFVADTGNDRIVKLSATGRVLAIWQ